MRYTYSLNLLGGLGVVGRFIIALVILIVLKNINENDKELSAGIRKLIFFGIVAAVVVLALIVLWFGFFGFAFSLPHFGHIYY